MAEQACTAEFWTDSRLGSGKHFFKQATREVVYTIDDPVTYNKQVQGLKDAERLAEAMLSFLGLGIQPPTPSWGNMIREGVANILQSPWMALFPGLALTFTVLAYNMVGDSLRDMFDPRMVLGGKPGAKQK